MLKNISLHLDVNEEIQSNLESKLAEYMSETHRSNINVFQRNIPSLVPFAQNKNKLNYSVFCNKDGEYNIVEFGQGRTFYGLHPSKEVTQHLHDFYQNPCYISIAENRNTGAKNSMELTDHFTAENPFILYKRQWANLPNKVNCLVVMGLGLGTHILQLLNDIEIKHLIIYEPEIQFFAISSSVTDWKSIIDIANKNSTGLYVQLGKDSRDLVQDIEELNNTNAIEGFYLYKHYNHVVFDEVYQQLLTNSWQNLTTNGMRFSTQQTIYNYVQHWTQATSLNEIELTSTNDIQYRSNLNALNKYFPEIAKEFQDYRPKDWIPVKNKEGQINLVQIVSGVFWYGESPKEDCQTNFEEFAKHPYKDGLILEYTGKKLLHYLHYRFVNEIDSYLSEISDEESALPNTIKSIIMFGIGAGYQLETLLEKHNVDKLFLCEPNKDFFYASLFAIDWASLLKDIDAQGARIYLNIGDDGNNLVRDLMNQFYSVGPYLLNDTYFYPGYYNARINESIANLREQLKIVVAMGEYYDHARFGISQTTHAIANNYAHLRKSPNNKLTYSDKSVPVFLVGNGPSLDQSITSIKEFQDRAIVISCGTSLQVLHKNGIKPDFHAEIEQNRTTYEWCKAFGDEQFLSTLDLLSCNGIHPDTTDLFNDVFIAFKEGESSTVSTLEVAGEEDFEILQFAFPTVANLALNICLSLGLENIYLFGIDLGFTDNKQHHSKQSAYYDENGNELYNYHEANNTAIVVPGNFRKTVLTKSEFKISKSMMERSIANKHKSTHVYNCSDGAQIHGTEPLPIEHLLIVSDKLAKSAALKKIKGDAFSKIDYENFRLKYEGKYQQEALMSDLSRFQNLFADETTSTEQAHKKIENQKQHLFSSYSSGRSLMFYYLFGTSNYASAVFSRLLSSSSDETICTTRFNNAQTIWYKYLGMIVEELSSPQTLYDASSSLHWFRTWDRHVKRQYHDVELTIVTNSVLFKDSIQWWLEESRTKGQHIAKLNIIAIDNLENIDIPKSDYLIYFDANSTHPPESKFNRILLNPDENLRAEKGTLLCTNNLIDSEFMYKQELDSLGLSCATLIDFNTPEKIVDSTIMLAYFIVRCFLVVDKNMHIFPKYRLPNDLSSEDKEQIYTPFHLRDTNFYDFKEYIAIVPDYKPAPEVNNYGMRGKRLYNAKFSDFTYIEVPRERFDHWVAVYAENLPVFKTNENLTHSITLTFDNQQQKYTAQ